MRSWTVSRSIPGFYSDGQVTVDEGKISEYVKSLASKYNTAYTKRTFKTSYGPEVEVSGVYGWRIDQQAEAAALKEALAEGKMLQKTCLCPESGQP